MDGTKTPNPLDSPTGAAFDVELTVHEGLSAGETHRIKQFPVHVGRGRDAEIRLQDDPADPTLSRRHVRIGFEGGRIVLTDLSTNGTWIDTRHLTPGETVVLEGEQAVWLGPRTMITVRMLGSLAPPRRPPPPPGASRPPGPNRQPAPSPELEPEPRTAPSSLTPAAREAALEVSSGPGLIRLEINALGRFEVTVGGKAILDAAWSARKAMVLLAYLADQAGRYVSSDRLGEALWPDAEDGARQALQTTVSRVRKAFRSISAGLPDPIRHERAGYILTPDYDLRYDVRQFEAGCEQGMRMRAEGRLAEGLDRLEQALALYRGPFLDGHSDDWVHLRQRALESTCYEGMEDLAAAREQQGRLEEAIRILRVVVERDPCREQSQAGLVRCLMRAGHREDAVRQYQACARALRRLLGLSPGPDLVALYEALRIEGHPRAPVD